MDKINLDKDITIPELQTIILKSKNNKSPGLDGFSNQFFKDFWPDFNIILLKLMNSYREKGCIDENQNMGIITCFPKRGEDS